MHRLSLSFKFSQWIAHCCGRKLVEKPVFTTSTYHNRGHTGNSDNTQNQLGEGDRHHWKAAQVLLTVWCLQLSSQVLNPGVPEGGARTWVAVI